MNTSIALNEVRKSIEKVARSQTWDIEHAIPFPMDVLPLLQEASKLIARAHAHVRQHAQQHVWPARNAAVQRERTEAVHG